MSGLFDARLFGGHDDHLDLVARNVSTLYAEIFVDGAIGLLLSTAAVAIWTVGQRIALFPMVVASGAVQRQDRLQLILQPGTRLSLALAVPVCIGLIIMADRLIVSWVGPGFSDGVFVVRVLLAAVLCGVGAASASLILEGATHPRFNFVRGNVCAFPRGVSTGRAAS